MSLQRQDGALRIPSLYCTGARTRLSLIREERSELAVPPQEASVFFLPSHSTGRFHRESYALSSDFVADIKVRRHVYGHVDLCLYYSDHAIVKQAGSLEHYRSFFDNIFCCGDGTDLSFYPRFESVLVNRQLVVTESWGLVNFYALISGCDLAVVGASHPRYTERGSNTARASELRILGARAEVFLDRFVGKLLKDCSATRAISEPGAFRNLISAREDLEAVKKLLKDFDTEIMLKDPFSVYETASTRLLDRIL